MDEPTYVESFHYKEEVIKMTYLPLGNTGLRISNLSLGGGPIGGLYEDLEEDEAITLIQEAFRHGVNYIDTSPWYGQGRSERIIGKALKTIPRKAFYIGTKVGRYELDIERMFDFSAKKALQSIDESLQLLGLEYVDIIQIHDLEFAENPDQIIEETLPALQKIVNDGKARFIGITGYVLSVLKDVVEKSTIKIDTVLSYSRNTLIDHELASYIPFFKKNGIGVIDAGVIALGLLAPSSPQSWHPATEEIKKACEKAVQFCEENQVDITRLAIHYSFRTEGVTTHLIGVGKLAILQQNLVTVHKKLSEAELKMIEKVKSRFFASLERKNWEGFQTEHLKKLKEIRESSTNN